MTNILPILMYADGVTIGMNGKANLIPVMMTLGCIHEDCLNKTLVK